MYEIPIWNKKLFRTSNFQRTYCIDDNFINERNWQTHKFRHSLSIQSDLADLYVLSHCYMRLVTTSMCQSSSSHVIQERNKLRAFWRQFPSPRTISRKNKLGAFWRQLRLTKLRRQNAIVRCTNFGIRCQSNLTLHFYIFFLASERFFDLLSAGHDPLLSCGEFCLLSCGEIFE